MQRSLGQNICFANFLGKYFLLILFIVDIVYNFQISLYCTYIKVRSGAGPQIAKWRGSSSATLELIIFQYIKGSELRNAVYFLFIVKFTLFERDFLVLSHKFLYFFTIHFKG
jgi:hypothetical protein